MACRGCFECLLELLNFVLMISGLAMVGCGVYLLVEWNRVSSCCANGLASSVNANPKLMSLGRPMLLVVSVSTSIADHLQESWFIFLFIGVGVILVMISILGCIGIKVRNGCCLSCYSFLVILLILGEVAAAAFIFFDHSWEEEIPADQTDDINTIYNFLKEKLKISKWAALLLVILEASAFFLALIVGAAKQHRDYDSDEDEYTVPRADAHQPLVNRQAIPAAGTPVLGRRSSRKDVWSQRMRDKYGIDIAEITYNSSDPSRFQWATGAAAEERGRGRGRCDIL